MKKIYKSVFFVVFCFCVNLSAQSSGKIFYKMDADTIFGRVYFSHDFDAKLIQKVMDDPTDITMFKITKDQLIILDKNRKPIFPDTISVNKDEPFYLYSKDKLKELFDKSENKDNAEAIVEMRGSTVTITSGNFTLEQAALCPPFCP